MSVPDRLIEPYLRALSEWQGIELAVAAQRVRDALLHPMDLKKIMAGEVTACLHGVDAAMAARAEFVAQFSRGSFAALTDLPTVTDLALSIVEVVKRVGFAASNSEVRRVVEQKGLRLVAEVAGGGQDEAVVAPDEIRLPLGDVLTDKFGDLAADYFLKVGRKLARITRDAPIS
jgi:tyrosyl-tRNA synthetase